LKLTNIFGVFRPYIAMWATFIVELKAKFQLKFISNKVLIFLVR